MHVLEWIENGVQQTYEAPLFSDIVEMINILKSKNISFVHYFID